MELDRRTSLMILAALPGLGPVTIRRLDRAIDGGAQRLLSMTPDERCQWCNTRVVEQLSEWSRHFDPAKVAAALNAMGGDFLTWEDPDFPGELKAYGDCPVGLYRSRADSCLGTRRLAVVGTRRPSAYGRKVTRELTSDLCRYGFSIISGLADGIDTEAHRTALQVGGITAAVLGGGLLRCYPASNFALLKEVMQSGGAWSEFPLWRRADRRSFPQRNRIVSGLSEAVLVIESGATGGSLITARMASEQGKPVYVVPGRIDAAESAGCHALIRDGAQLVTSAEEILQDLNFLPGALRTAGRRGSSPDSTASVAREPADARSKRIWEWLGDKGTANLDQIAEALQLSVADVSSQLLSMEVDGFVSRRLDGRYERA